MTKRRVTITCIAAVFLVGVGSWWFFDLGLGYQSIELRREVSFEQTDPHQVDFSSSTNFVVDYRVGRRASRSTTAHGYSDRILIEFTPSKEASGICDVVKVARLGYRRGGNYRIASRDDAWIEIRQSQDCFYVEAAIKITNSEGGGHWEIIYIPPTKIE